MNQDTTFLLSNWSLIIQFNSFMHLLFTALTTGKSYIIRTFLFVFMEPHAPKQILPEVHGNNHPDTHHIHRTHVQVLLYGAYTVLLRALPSHATMTTCTPALCCCIGIPNVQILACFLLPQKICHGFPNASRRKWVW